MTVLPATSTVPRRPGHLAATHLLRSEWTKLRSVRSTRWSLLAAFVALAGLGMLFAAVQMSEWTNLAAHHPRILAAERAHYSAIDAGVAGYNLAQLAIGVLGVLAISGEYATGMIRSSLMAVPRRLPVLWAKLGVFAAVTFVLMLVAALVGFEGVQAIVSGQGVNRSLGDPDALRVVFGTALYLTAIGALGLGLGALLRNTAGAISALVGLLFVLPGVIAVLPGDSASSISPYLPLNAGSAIATAHFGGGEHLAPWAGFGLLCAYVAVVLALAALRLVRRDA
jgi:ABC-2 type transport system permease protein